MPALPAELKGGVIPARFVYHAPTTVAEALRLLATHGSEARLLAGGQSLLPVMKFRLAAPAHLIDLGRIPDLRGIRVEGDAVTIGAMTTHWTIESSPVLRDRIPLLPQSAAQVGDVQVRNLGTIGGSLAHADPAADYPAAVLALDAEMIALGPRGRRTITAADFFTGIYATALAHHEMLLEIRVSPPPARTGAAYVKFPHPASGFAVVGVAAVVTLDAQGRCARARLGLTGVAPVPYRARAAEDRLAGQLLTDEVIAGAAAVAVDGVEVNADVFAPAEYRRHLGRVFTERAIQRARESIP